MRGLMSLLSMLHGAESQASAEKWRRDEKKRVSQENSAFRPAFRHHGRQKPFPQHHEVIGLGLPKHQPHALIRLDVNDAGLGLEELVFSEEFYRQDGANRIRAFCDHVAAIQAESRHARRPFVFGRAFAHFNGPGERIPRGATSLLLHGTPGQRKRDDSTLLSLSSVKKLDLPAGSANFAALLPPSHWLRLVLKSFAMPQTDQEGYCCLIEDPAWVILPGSNAVLIVIFWRGKRLSSVSKVC